jgi:hypothetical protein
MNELTSNVVILRARARATRSPGGSSTKISARGWRTPTHESEMSSLALPLAEAPPELPSAGDAAGREDADADAEAEAEPVAGALLLARGSTAVIESSVAARVKADATGSAYIGGAANRQTAVRNIGVTYY